MRATAYLLFPVDNCPAKHSKGLFQGQVHKHCIRPCRESSGEAESQTVAAQESGQPQLQWTSEDNLDDVAMEP